MKTYTITGITEEQARYTIGISKPAYFLLTDSQREELYAQFRPQLTPDRQTVLSEKWKPKPDDTDVWYIDKQNNYSRLNKKFCGYICVSDLAFAPTESLAAEIVAVRKGEWLARGGDVVFVLDRKTLEILSSGGIMYSDVRGEESKHYIYFPSAEQRTRFLSEQKQELDKVRELRLNAEAGYYGLLSNFQRDLIDAVDYIYRLTALEGKKV